MRPVIIGGAGRCQITDISTAIILFSGAYETRNYWGGGAEFSKEVPDH